MILDDFIMLGTTVPEPSKSTDRIFVCSAGYSPELRHLVRIYPLARRDVPKRWNIYRVPVERNPHDWRQESYQVRGDRSEGRHESINDRFDLVGRAKKASGVVDDDIVKQLDKHTVASIAEANARRLSLAIVKPTFYDLTFDHNPDSPDSPQLALFDLPGTTTPTAGSKRFPFNPRLEFIDEDGRHNLQIRDWGAYEWMRKYGPDRRHELESCLHLSATSSLLVGNMANRRNNWLIISVLSGIREAAPSLFDELEQEAS